MTFQSAADMIEHIPYEKVDSTMETRLYKEFTASDDKLRIYKDETPIYSSKKDGILPLMEYIDSESAGHQSVTILDKVTGNAAALLAVKVKCLEVYSPLGSELAIKTLERHGISYHFETVAPYIQRADGKGMCPMEELSIGKEPEEFYEAVKARLETGNQANTH